MQVWVVPCVELHRKAVRNAGSAIVRSITRKSERTSPTPDLIRIVTTIHHQSQTVSRTAASRIRSDAFRGYLERERGLEAVFQMYLTAPPQCASLRHELCS